MSDLRNDAAPSGASREEPMRDAARIGAELASLGGGTDPFAAAVRATCMPVVVTDPRLPDNPMVFVNDAFCRLSGYAREELLGRNCRFLQAPDTDLAAVEVIRAAIRDARPAEVDILNRRKDGSPFWNRLMIAPVRGAGGELAYFVASQVDVTVEHERLQGLETSNAALMAEVTGRMRAQQESEARLRFATEAGRLGIWELDLATGAFAGSDIFRRNFGRAPGAAFTREEIAEAVHPDDRARRDAALERALIGGSDYDIEYRIVRPDGAVAWLQVRAQVARSADGRPLRLAGISLDVTDRREAEEEARRTAALLRAILATAPGLIYAKDLQGRMLVANGPVMELIGKPWAEVQGRTDIEFLDDPAQGEGVMASDRRVMAGGRTEVVEESIGADGERPRVWLSAKAPLRDQAGAVAGMVGVSVDISGRKRAEERLRELNATLEARVAERTRERDRTWNNSQDLLVVIDRRGVFRAANPAWTAVLGWPPDEVVGRSYLEFIHPDDHALSQGALARVSGDALDRYENRFRHKEGGWRWIQWAASPEGDLVYASGRHVTAEKENAEALARAEEALRHSQKMEAVGQLTGGLAHDFNNLLTGIAGSLELLRKRLAAGRTEDLDRYAVGAVAAAQRAAALTQRLLAFARRQPLDPKRVDANRLVAGMEELLRRTLGFGVRLELALSDGLWPVMCDSNQLENALLNLAINARDAMPDGGVLTVATANADVDEACAQSQGGEVKPGRYVSVSVTDTGTGMTPDVIAKAFDPFFTTKPIGQGTGLGLSMLYGFAKQSGGHVAIVSEAGRGTTMKLCLPRHSGNAEEDANVPEASAAVADAAPADAGETVLVVEDEATVRMLITETLRELGCRTIEAADGPSGLRVLQSGARVDLLVTDVGLPGLNGRQLADAARVARPDLKVLFVTGYAHDAALGRGTALEPGMELITKPFSLDDLAAKMRGMLEGGQGTPSP